MASEEYRNQGSVTKAEIAGDITSNTNIVDNITFQAPIAIYNNGIVPTTVPQKISFKNVPKPHGAFIGRVEYINTAIKYLTQPVTADVQIQFPCLVIHALGGYGKTQTARKIASVCMKESKFQHFIWIDSEDDVSVKKCFVEVMKQVGLHASIESDAINFESSIYQFYKILSCRSKEKFLFIFDNVDDFENILKFLPLNHQASNFAVLMTSQHPFTQESYGYVRNQPLDLMLEKEAITLVERILGTSTTDSEDDKKLLVERSGRIALVLYVMTSTIKFHRRSKSAYSINNYLMEMGDLPIQYCDDSNKLDLTYKKSLQKVVQFAIEKMNAFGGPIETKHQAETIAVDIFDRLAYCSSTNRLTESFVQKYFWDICEEAKKVDMKLPIKPVDNVQIIRLTIEKLSEFSLVQIGGDKLTVHRLVQASRRLDLKGNEKTVLKKLLFIVPDRSRYRDRNTSIIWQHVVNDYADLVYEFYIKRRTLMKFPILNVDLLEKVIRILTKSADFQPLGNYSEEVEEIICRQIRLDAIKRIVDVFNYDVMERSTKLLSKIIVIFPNLDAVKWLINEKSCIPKEDNFRKCFNISGFSTLAWDLEKLKELSVEIIKETREKSLFERAFNKLTWLFRSPISQRIANLRITGILFAMADSEQLKMRLCQAIEKYYGKNALELVLHSRPIKVDNFWSQRFIKMFEIHGCMLSALEKLEPSVALDDLKERYAENSLLECLFICGRTHSRGEPFKFEMNSLVMNVLNWNDLHRAAYENNITAIKSIDPTLIESKDKKGCTPLMIAAEYGACEATTVLLEQHSANINAMNKYGTPSIIRAIWNRNPSICKILLSHGAKTHWRTESGEQINALHEAIQDSAHYDRSESEEIVAAFLSSKDCDVCSTDEDGDNVLHLLVYCYYATKYKPNHRVLHLIQSANATLVNMRNNDGFTPLQLAKNLQAKFSDYHWHVASLQSFISEVDKLRNSEK